MSTKIEWTDETWNPVGGCEIESPGCANCYAQRLAGTRLKHHPLYAGTTDLVKGKPVFNGTLTVAADDHHVWGWPWRWRGAKRPKLGPSDRPRSVYGERRGAHSVKPARYRDMIDAMWPARRKLELFPCADGSAPPQRQGWSFWGNQRGGDA